MNIMKANMGFADRIIRVLIAVIILIAYFDNRIGGALGVIALVVAIAFIITSFVGFCPMYKPFRFSTRKKHAV